MRTRLLRWLVFWCAGTCLSGTAVAEDPGDAWIPYCAGYAQEAVAQTLLAQDLAEKYKCTNDDFSNFILWSSIAEHHMTYCMDAIRTDLADVNSDRLEYIVRDKAARKRGIEQCQAQAAASDASSEPTTARVNDNVDLYNSPGGGGEVIGMLEADTTVQFHGCQDDNWCEVEGGWVWGDFLDR